MEKNLFQVIGINSRSSELTLYYLSVQNNISWLLKHIQTLKNAKVLRV